jgi:hypothetical protein
MAKRQKSLAVRVSQAEVENWCVQAYGEGKSIRKISEEARRDFLTVSRHLNKPESLKREKEIHDMIAKEARGYLARNVRRAAQSWVKQLDLVDEGKRGNHLPARDLLTHTGVVDIAVPNQDRGTQILIQIGGGSADTFTPETIDVTPDK